MYKRCLIFLMLISNLAYLFGETEANYTTIEDKAKTSILTPSFSEQKKIKIRLNNGLEAYLISDPETKQSAAALIVKVGSWEDPKDYPGLAHFNEHMLFLGTKKYPKESEYDRFITENGGTMNAFTSNDYTAYIFSVNNQAFEEGLDRFSNFFKEPLFNSSGVSREINAIDQEYSKNLENDDVREYFVFKELSNPQHPFHAFSMGNKASLAHVEREVLKKWYGSHYSSNLMRLMVISPLPLDQLLHLVVDDFKDIPNKNRQLELINEPLFTKVNEPALVYIEPIKNTRRLSLSWDLPTQFSGPSDSNPDDIVSHILGHEGPKSLLADLKHENLALELSCASLDIGLGHKEYFIEIELTDLGIEKIYKVIEKVFQTLANLRQKGIPEYIFKEIQKMNLLKYQYQQRQEAFDTMMRNATMMAHENMDTYPEKTLLLKQYDPKAIKELLDYLTPQNCHFDVLAPQSVTKIKPDKKEKWLGVDYAIKPIPSQIFKTWINAKPAPNIDLPEKNPFIPDNFDLLNVSIADEAKILPQPLSILNNDRANIYYAADTQFHSPQIGWNIDIKTPLVDVGNPMLMASAELYVKFLTESLNQTSYLAKLGGLQNEIITSENGIKISINGYNDKAHILLETIFQYIKNLDINEEKFKIYKDVVLRDFQDFEKELPVKQAFELTQATLYKYFSTHKQKAAALKKINFEKFKEYSKKIFNKAYIQAFLFGNMTQNQAKNISEILEKSLSHDVYAKNEQLNNATIVLPEKGGPFYIESKLSVQGNTVVLAIENPEPSYQNWAVQQILMQAMSEPFFATLRTKQQTGYIVTNMAEILEKHCFDFFAVQSNTHDPRDLLARFELFIEGYLQEFHSELTAERFDTIRKALVQNIKSQYQNTEDVAKLLYTILSKHNADFELLDKRIKALEDLTYEQLLRLAPQSLGKDNKRRLAILLKGNQVSSVFQYKKIQNIYKLQQLSSFTSQDLTP